MGIWFWTSVALYVLGTVQSFGDTGVIFDALLWPLSAVIGIGAWDR